MMEHQERLDTDAVREVKEAENASDSARDFVSRRAERPVVRDEESGRVGELMFLGDWDDPDARPVRTYRLAFIRPLGGGVEWVTDPERVTVLSSYERALTAVDAQVAGAPTGAVLCGHPTVRRRDGKTHCRDCGAQIYL